ncbi:hypothetical protein [Arthrobacter alpinus]|nr:hypothetical protein [Arthrobacter alpinus]
MIKHNVISAVAFNHVKILYTVESRDPRGLPVRRALVPLARSV